MKIVSKWFMLITLITCSLASTSFASSADDLQKVMMLAQMTKEMTSQAATMVKIQAIKENSNPERAPSNEVLPASEDPQLKEGFEGNNMQGYSAEGRHSSPKANLQK
jgi:hypothetical protein